MRYGIREVCDMEFTKFEGSGQGPSSFVIKSAKTSTLEGAATTVYAQGGKGNSRLMAWEGEKTLTFTVEDALISMESFWALTGTDAKNTEKGVRFTAKTTSFAAYYSIIADTLFRDEEGVDHAARIIIPRAKLQTNLSLAMAPTGDPSTFTFTFDAFPALEDNIATGIEKDMLFAIEVDHKDGNNVVVDELKTTVVIEGLSAIETEASILTVAAGGAITLGGETVEMTEVADWKEGAILTDLATHVTYATGGTFALADKKVNKFYIC